MTMEFGKPVLPPKPEKRKRTRAGGSGDLGRWNETIQRMVNRGEVSVRMASVGAGGGGPIPDADAAPNVGNELEPLALLTTEYVEGPDGAPPPKVYGAKQRTRSAIARGAVAKGASGERDVLNALRDVMTNVETELRDDGYEFVPRSEFCNRRRLEKNRSREDISGVPLISIEVKRNENLNIGKAWEQAVSQATERRLPVLVYKFNREPWRVRTWLAFTTPHGSIAAYTVAETTLPDFLAYYSGIYRAFLAEGLK